MCCVQVERRGGGVVGVGGLRGERGGHLLYSLFTRKERIKIYKETPLSFPKNPELRTPRLVQHDYTQIISFFVLFLSTIENMLFL